MADKLTKSLYLKFRTKENGEKIISKDGTPVVDGAIDIFLRKQYGVQTVTSVSEVNKQNGPMTVCNCEGSVKVDEFLQKQLKYFFDVDFPLDSFVGIKVSVWGTWGRVLSKFRMAEGDKCMFVLNSIKVESFTRKNGEVGYELRAAAFDFKQTYTKRNEDGTRAPAFEAVVAPAYDSAAAVKPAPTATSAPTAASAPIPNAGYSQNIPMEDFAAIDDGDLPF